MPVGSLSTSRLHLPYPQLSDAADITAVGDLAKALDHVAQYDSGTYSTRGAVGQPGRVYRITDTGPAGEPPGTSFLDTGTAWVRLVAAASIGTTELADGSVTDAKLAGGVAVPVGGLVATVAVTWPAAFLKCDGSTKSRSTYAALFAALGGTNTALNKWGQGNGTTTFNVPDYTGRAPFGVGAYGDGGPGVVGGEANHVLTIDEMPAHAHNARGWYSGAGIGVVGGGVTGYLAIQPSNLGASWNWNAEQSIFPAGSFVPHNNMPPYATATWLVRAL